MKFAIIIVNYQTTEYTIKTLEMLCDEIEVLQNFSIIVVENNSRDDSEQKLRDFIQTKNVESNVSVCSTERNGGFGAGNNFAIRKLLSSDNAPEYIYLLNPDAIPEKGSINRMIRFLDEHVECGIVGSAVKNSQGVIINASFKYPNIFNEFHDGARSKISQKLLKRWLVADKAPEKISEAEWVTGSSLMIRSDLFRRIGLFDENYFLYYEETDLCYRAKKNGWKIFHLPESCVEHIGGVATDKVNEGKKRTPSYIFHSRKHFFLKHHGRCYLWVSNLLFLTGYTMRVVNDFIFSKKSAKSSYFVRDFIRNSF